ncbi:MAG: IS110 family transposase, partial [Candidatus Limnocylindria bacterium]
MRTIGLDVHRHFAEVAILDGPRRSAQRISTDPQALRAFAATLGTEDQVVLEATANTWAIAELLRSHAGRVVVSNPLRTKAIADAKIKTDKVDAQTLAQLLAANFIPEVWVPDAPTQALRRRIAHRRALVQQRTRLRNLVHAALIRALRSCPYSDLFGKGGRAWLAAQELAADERASVDCGLRLHDALATEIAAVDRALAQSALAHADAQLLCTISGIGPVTAVAICAVIGPISRFSRPNKLVGYLGLDPTVRQSGERPARTGHISHAGQAHARGYSSRRRTMRCARRVRWPPSTRASPIAGDPRSRRWPWRASWRCSSGMSSASGRRTAGPAPHALPTSAGGSSSRRERRGDQRAGPRERPGPSGCKWSAPRSSRPSATTAGSFVNARGRGRRNGAREVRPSRGTMRGGGDAPDLRSSSRGRPRPERERYDSRLTFSSVGG